jgi:hypothetical protein
MNHTIHAIAPDWSGTVAGQFETVAAARERIESLADTYPAADWEIRRGAELVETVRGVDSLAWEEIQDADTRPESLCMSLAREEMQRENDL